MLINPIKCVYPLNHGYPILSHKDWTNKKKSFHKRCGSSWWESQVTPPFLFVLEKAEKCHQNI